MGKFLIRITVLITSVYIVISCYLAQFKGIDILSDWYSLLFELCVIVCCFGQGKFHCRYLRFLAIGTFMSDLITRLDNYYNFLSVSEHNLTGICFVYTGGMVCVFSALHHFHKVTKLKQKREKLYGSNSTTTNNNNRIEYD